MGECFQDVVDFSSVFCHGSGSDAELTVWQTDWQKNPELSLYDIGAGLTCGCVATAAAAAAAGEQVEELPAPGSCSSPCVLLRPCRWGWPGLAGHPDDNFSSPLNLFLPPPSHLLLLPFLCWLLLTFFWKLIWKKKRFKEHFLCLDGTVHNRT